MSSLTLWFRPVRVNPRWESSRLHVLARTHLLGLAYPAGEDVIELGQLRDLEGIHEQAGGVGIDPLYARIKHLTLQIQVSAEPPVLGHGAREDAPAAFQVDSRLVHAVAERATLLHQGDEAPVQVHDLSGPILQVPLNGPGVRACGLLQAHQKSPGRKRRFTSPEM